MNSIQTEMIVSEGVACKKKCAENFRDCKCGEKLHCQVVGDFLILEFGGSEFVAEYWNMRQRYKREYASLEAEAEQSSVRKRWSELFLY